MMRRKKNRKTRRMIVSRHMYEKEAGRKGREGQRGGKPEELSLREEARMREEEVVRKRLKGGYENLSWRKVMERRNRK